MRTKSRLRGGQLVAAPYLLVAMVAAAAPPDRQQVQAILLADGYSGVASLRLANRSWVGVGAHDGAVMHFAVDAATGRLLSEVEAH